MKYTYAAINSATSMGFALAAYFLAVDVASPWIRTLAVSGAAAVGSIAAMKLSKKWV